MVRPIRGSPPSAPSLCWPASASAATSIAGPSRKLPASPANISRERSSRSSGSSPAHACRRNASRSPGERSSANCSRLSSCFQRSEFIACPDGQFAVEPEFGGAPVAPDCDERYFEHFGRLFHAESAKEAHFDDLHFAWIEPPQRVHRVIERDEVGGPVAAHQSRLFQRNMLRFAPAFRVMPPRMVHQDAPHQLG